MPVPGLPTQGQGKGAHSRERTKIEDMGPGGGLRLRTLRWPLWWAEIREALESLDPLEWLLLMPQGHQPWPGHQCPPPRPPGTTTGPHAHLPAHPRRRTQAPAQTGRRRPCWVRLDPAPGLDPTEQAHRSLARLCAGQRPAAPLSSPETRPDLLESSHSPKGLHVPPTWGSPVPPWGAGGPSNPQGGGFPPAASAPGCSSVPRSGSRKAALHRDQKVGIGGCSRLAATATPPPACPEPRQAAGSSFGTRGLRRQRQDCTFFPTSCGLGVRRPGEGLASVGWAQCEGPTGLMSRPCSQL